MIRDDAKDQEENIASHITAKVKVIGVSSIQQIHQRGGSRRDKAALCAQDYWIPLENNFNLADLRTKH